MSAPENNPALDPDQKNNDGQDQTTSNDNAELDRINDATVAAEPSFTLNYEGSKPEKEEENDGEELKH